MTQVGDKLVNAIAADGEYLWIGTANGLLKYNIVNQTVSNSTHSSVQEATHDFVLGGLVESGLSDNYINAIIVLETEVWVGTQKGLSIYNKNSGAFTITQADDLPMNNVRALGYDKARNCIWIGTSAGLAKYDLKTRQCSNLNNPNIFPHTISKRLSCWMTRYGWGRQAV